MGLPYHLTKVNSEMVAVIYHNQNCGTSRNTLALIRHFGIEPKVIDYLNSPPSFDELKSIISNAGLTPRKAIRQKGTPYLELGLDDVSLTDDQLIDTMVKCPILINRPFVVTPLGTRLCRPSEVVLDILPPEPVGAFSKEDGQEILNSEGLKID